MPELILRNDLIGQFIKSVTFCMKCMGYSLLISMCFCYISTIPLVRPFCIFLRKFRFLPSTGLSFLFMKMTDVITQQMTWMMVFGVTAYLIDSFIGIALSVSDDDLLYARSLRLNKWQEVRETLIFGKSAQMVEAFIQNFAIAWMMIAAIENISKAAGGIGVILADGNKYYKFDKVYAVQLLILLTGILIDWSLRTIKTFLLPHSKFN